MVYEVDIQAVQYSEPVTFYVTAESASEALEIAEGKAWRKLSKGDFRWTKETLKPLSVTEKSDE